MQTHCAVRVAASGRGKVAIAHATGIAGCKRLADTKQQQPRRSPRWLRSCLRHELDASVSVHAMRTPRKRCKDSTVRTILSETMTSDSDSFEGHDIIGEMSFMSNRGQAWILWKQPWMERGPRTIALAKEIWARGLRCCVACLGRALSSWKRLGQDKWSRRARVAGGGWGWLAGAAPFCRADDGP